MQHVNVILGSSMKITTKHQ